MDEARIRQLDTERRRAIQALGSALEIVRRATGISAWDYATATEFGYALAKVCGNPNESGIVSAAVSEFRVPDWAK